MQATPSSPNLLTASVARLVAYLVETRARAAVGLLVALVAAGFALAFGAGIHVDTDLKRLLPSDAPSVRALESLSERKGSAELFTLAVEEPDPVARQAMIDGLAETVEAWPETTEIYTKRDYTVLRDHALYFLELEELERLRDKFLKERKEAAARAMAASAGFGGEVDVEQVAVGEDDWDAPLDDDGGEDDPAQAADPDEDLDLREWLDKHRNSLAADGKLTKKDIDLMWLEENEAGEIVWEDEVGDAYISRDGDVQVLKAALDRAPTDVKFAQELTLRIEARVAEMQAQGIAPDARVGVVAAYNVSKQVDTVVQDAKRATAVSLSLVVLVLVIGLRSLRSILIVVIPLGVATCFTLATARLLVSELNALTIFMFAVLFGMGVDFAVHLFALRRGQPALGWPEIVNAHLRPLASSMLTTSGSLLALQFAEFKAFREFGLISAAGVFICFVAAVLLVPIIETLIPARRAVSEAPVPARPTGRMSPLRWALLALALGVAAYGAPKAAFEKDLRNVKAKPVGETIHYGTATGRCSKFLTLLVDDPVDLDVAVQRLAEERDAKMLLPGRPDLPDREAKPWVRDVYSVGTVMPTGQEAKQAVLEEVADQANHFLAELPDLDDEARAYQTHLEALERLAKAEPLRVEELPRWALQPFVEKGGHYDRIGQVCLKIRAGHLDELVAVTKRLDVLLEDEVLRADSRLVLAQVVTAVEDDSRGLPAIALGVILIFIAADLRRVVGTLACFGALLLGLALAVAAMGLVPINANFFNLVVLPAVLGVSIDTGIHLWYSRERTSYRATGRATIVSALTTMAGFAGLLVAEHPGMRSIGELGVAAVAACVGVIFVALYPGGTR